MKKVIIPVLIIAIPTILFAQEVSKSAEIKRNTIYIEAGGQTFYYSINFDRLCYSPEKIKTSYSVGISVLPGSEYSMLAIPFSYNYLSGKKNNHLEMGMGLTFTYQSIRNFSVVESVHDQNGILQTTRYKGHRSDFLSYLTPKIGYRYQKPGGGIFFRATLTPPLVGIVRVFKVKGEFTTNFPANTSYYFNYFPWGGLSLGWTFKK